MNPQDTTTQDPNVPEGLDPTAFYLTKAIKQTETGGSSNAYTTTGKSGEFGAYQYEPATWSADAQKYLGQDVPLQQATEAQQNQVAYSKIKDLLAENNGDKTAVASIWNSGKADPNATGTGTNSLGVAYDVPGYVNKVKEAYMSYANGSGATPQNTPTQGQADLTNENASDNQTPAANIQTPPGTPPPSPSLLSEITNVLGKVFPGKEVGESIGTLAGYIQTKISDAVNGTNNAQYYDLSHPTLAQVGGDIAQGTLAVGTAEAGLEDQAGVDVFGKTITNPISEASTTLGRVGQSAAVAGAFGAANATAQGKPIEQVGEQAGIGALAGGALGGAVEAGGALASAFTGKTDAEIASMAANPNITDKELASLSPTERSRFNELKSDQINDTTTAAKTQRDQLIQQETQRVNQTDTDLKEQLDTTKNKQALALKPLAAQSLKDNSNLFMEKVENGLAQGANLNKKIPNLVPQIEEAVNAIQDPAQKALAQQQFGLDSLITTNPETGTITYKKVSLGDIWNNSKDLRATLSTGAKSGNKTFSADEYATVKNTKILTDILEKNGMDLSEANEFWSKWAKLRQRIVSEVKPFDTEGNLKAPIESTIERASTPTAKGFNNAKSFISELEKQTGLPEGSITSDTEKVLNQIKKNKLDKANIPNITKQINAQIQADKTIANKNLDSQQFSVQQIVDRKAKINRIVLGVLRTAGLIGLGYEGVKHIL